jgi:hypothetical protein
MAVKSFIVHSLGDTVLNKSNFSNKKVTFLAAVKMPDRLSFSKSCFLSSSFERKKREMEMKNIATAGFRTEPLSRVTNGRKNSFQIYIIIY